TQVSVPVDLGTGTRTLRFTVSARFDVTPAGAAIGDQFLVYLVNPNNPNQTLLDRGQPGTALFRLSGSEADYVPGHGHCAGPTVSVDVPPLTGVTKGLLVFQLLAGDAATGSVVTVDGLSNTVNPTGAPGSAFPHSEATAPAGPALDLGELSPSADLH